MTETASIYKGDTAGPWNVGHLLDDGTLATITGGYSCTIKVAGSAIERAVTDTTVDSKRFIAALTPTETDTLAVGQHVVAIEVVNNALTPPLRVETHIILTVSEQIVGSSYVPVAETEVERITREISEARTARAAQMRGETVQEIWRDGRRIVRKIPSLKELNDLIFALERELVDATNVAAGRPKRRAMSLAWRG